MRRHTLLFAFVLLLARAPVWAQTNITSTQCASIGISNSSSTVTIQVTGTWTGTLQPQLSIQGQALVNTQVTPSTSTTAQSTITANGVYYANAPAGSPATFYVCGNTVGSGTANVFLNLSSGVSTSTLGGGGAGASAFNTITAGTNTNALVEGTGGSLSPSGIGQIAATQDLWTVGPPAPTVNTTANTGGSLISTHAGAWRITFNSAAGQTLAGGETSTVSNYAGLGSGCVSGSACTVTINAPTLPSGYTSYTVYGKDCATTPCTGGETTVTGCVAITTNCVETTIPSGSALPTANTAYSQPSPVGTNVCSPGTNPMLYSFDGTNYYAYAGIDGANTGTNPPSPYNKLSICRPVWINDSSTDPPLGRNSLALDFHLQNGTVTNAANQDRARYIFALNCVPDANCSDSSTHYGLEALQVEQDIMGTPTINGSPDGEVTAISGQLGFFATSNIASTSFGTNVVRASLFREIGAAVDTQGMSAIQATFANLATTTGSSQYVEAGKFTCGSSVAVTNLQCSTLKLIGQGSTNQFTQQNFIFMPLSNGWNPRGTQGANNQDYAVRNDNYNLQWMLGGPTYVTSLATSDSAPLTLIGSVNTNTLTAAQLTIPNIGSVSCSGGASQYTYQLVGIDTNGGAVASATQNTAASCVNPLTVGNPATVNIGDQSTNMLGQFSRIDVYRTGGPMGTGKIGNLTVAGGGGTWTCTHSTISNNFTCGAIADTGLTADGGTVPATNTTGGIGTPANAVSHLKGNLFQVASPGFTTANNTSLQTITGLVFNLSQIAQNYSFHCSLSYSQATANAAVAFGIQSATVAPTNIFANGWEEITVGPPATEVNGTLATLASTTATNIVSGTPGATATNYMANLDGTIEEPANDAGNVINIMVSTATGTDAVTVLRGSYCTLY